MSVLRPSIFPPAGDFTPETTNAVERLAAETEVVAYRRDRLLSSLVLLGTIGLLMAAPFALRAGAGFFMPVTVAIVIALVLVPALEWLERRGLPSGLAAITALLGFLVIANATLVAIVVPAGEWVRLLPSAGARIRENLAPVLDAFKTVQRFSDQIAGALGQAAQAATPAKAEPPTSIIELVADSAPGALAQALFALLLVYFFLATWTEMRERAIRGRESLAASLRVARLLRDVVSNTAAYILTIAGINAAVGAATALACWALGMPTPLMWGGLAALFNFVPYAGPVLMAGLMAAAGLAVFPDIFTALLPAAAFLGIHMVEANALTPAIVGRRLTINPLAILIALSFWGWVWGTVGALISVPLLIMTKVVLDRVGKPDVLGFLFEGETLGPGHDTVPMPKTDGS